MAKVTITDYVDVMDGDSDNGLLFKLFTSTTDEIKAFELVGADGDKAFGKAASTNEARFLVIGAGVFGKTAGKGEALACTRLAEVKLSAALNIGTKLYLANTTAGVAGELVSDLATTEFDLIQEVGVVVTDKTGGATSKFALIDIRPSAVIPTT